MRQDPAGVPSPVRSLPTVLALGPAAQTKKRSANGVSLAADGEAGHPIATNACSFKEERDGIPEHGRWPEKQTQPARLSQAPHERVCLRSLSLSRTRLGELLFPIIGGQSNRHGWSVSVSDRL